MTRWLAETDLIRNISTTLLQARQDYYSEETVRDLVIEHPQLCKRHLITRNAYEETLYGLLIDHRVRPSKICIVFLHGLASNILEGCKIAEHLPVGLGLFCFDFSGSGKSGGSLSTFGLKEHEDIRYVMRMLEGEGYEKFVLWGRSMGAVASLLACCSRFMRDDVLLQVVDSPFASFEAICHYHAQTHLHLPALLVPPAVAVLKESYHPHKFNPFRINLINNIRSCRTPTLFLYNETDEIIPASNSEDLIRRLDPACSFERLLISDAHNSMRSKRTIELVFERIRKYVRQNESARQKGGKRRMMNVYSSFVKKDKESKKSFNLYSEKEEPRDKMRRSVIFCSLSRKHPRKYSPELGGRPNPESRQLR